MAKLAVADVDVVLFQTTLRVQVGDVNYGGHLANDAVLRLCHEVRMHQFYFLKYKECNHLHKVKNMHKKNTTSHLRNE